DKVILGNLDHENYISILTITETEVEAYNVAIISGSHLASCYLS
ncbi:2329_t:CDS:1, partial [Funneliformis mosseae]